jgi:hypothetical protein
MVIVRTGKNIRIFEIFVPETGACKDKYDAFSHHELAALISDDSSSLCPDRMKR